MDIEALRVFVRVAELASFTSAANALGLAKGRVSTSVRQLEDRLGTRLFHRTTRNVRLTQDGEQLLERCRGLLAEADELQALFQRSPAALRGRLRVDMPNHLARSFVIPRLPEFLARHPLIELELSSTDRRVDVVHEGFDCVLRVGSLVDSGLIAKRLGVLRLINCASPAYLNNHGTPRTLADLASHRLVQYVTPLGSVAALGWEFRDGDSYRFWPMPGNVTVNSTDAYQAACLAGLGIVQVPLLGVASLLADGRLVEVMPDFVGAPMPVSLVWAHRHNLPKRVEAFVAWLTEILSPHLDEPRA